MIDSLGESPSAPEADSSQRTTDVGLREEIPHARREHIVLREALARGRASAGPRCRERQAQSLAMTEPSVSPWFEDRDDLGR